MSVASFCRRWLVAWRKLSRQLWPMPAEDPVQKQKRRLEVRLGRLQQRMLAVRHRLAGLAIQQHELERRERERLGFIAARLGTSEALSAALELEHLRERLARIPTRRERLEVRYQRLLKRFRTLRAVGE